jgi:hypothetical protein
LLIAGFLLKGTLPIPALAFGRLSEPPQSMLLPDPIPNRSMRKSIFSAMGGHRQARPGKHSMPPWSPMGVTMPTLLPAQPEPILQKVPKTAAGKRALLRQSLEGANKEERSTKRVKFADSRADRARFPGQTILEQEAIDVPSGVDYVKRMAAFRLYCKAAKIKISSKAKKDFALVTFLNHGFTLGWDHSEAGKYFAAFLDAHPECSHKTMLPRSRRALQGWSKLDPGKTRPPLPFELICLIVLQMMTMGMEGSCAGLAILLMFVTYLRPGEALALNSDDLVLPNASLRGFALNLHPSERKEDSKVGLSDETLLLANAAVPEIGSYLLVLKKLHAGTALFQLEYLQLKALWEAALRKTGLDTGYAVLYQVRHSGPSFDRLHQHRSILEVKSRGRWTSDSSVRRYEAHARLSQEFARLPKALQKEASAAPSTLLAKLRNFSYRSLSKP